MPSTVLEQKAIVNVLKGFEKEIEALEVKKAKFEQIKQGMMQQLLTGKIRLIWRDCLGLMGRLRPVGVLADFFLFLGQ